MTRSYSGTRLPRAAAALNRSNSLSKDRSTDRASSISAEEQHVMLRGDKGDRIYGKAAGRASSISAERAREQERESQVKRFRVLPRPPFFSTLLPARFAEQANGPKLQASTK